MALGTMEMIIVTAVATTSGIITSAASIMVVSLLLVVWLCIPRIRQVDDRDNYGNMDICSGHNYTSILVYWSTNLQLAATLYGRVDSRFCIPDYSSDHFVHNRTASSRKSITVITTFAKDQHLTVQ